MIDAIDTNQAQGELLFERVARRHQGYGVYAIVLIAVCLYFTWPTVDAQNWLGRSALLGFAALVVVQSVRALLRAPADLRRIRIYRDRVCLDSWKSILVRDLRAIEYVEGHEDSYFVFELKSAEHVQWYTPFYGDDVKRVCNALAEHLPVPVRVNGHRVHHIPD